MQIQLSQVELEIAVRDYVKSLGVSRPVGEINFVATRGSAGFTAEIQMDQIGLDGPASVSCPSSPQTDTSVETSNQPSTEEADVEAPAPKAKASRSKTTLFAANKPTANTEVAKEPETTEAVTTVAVEPEVSDNEAAADEVLPASTVAKKKLFG